MSESRSRNEQGFGYLPTESGLQVEGKDLTPAMVLLLSEQLAEIVKGRAVRGEDGLVKELVPQERWAFEWANGNLKAAGSDERF